MQRWATLTVREEEEAVLLLPAKGELKKVMVTLHSCSWAGGQGRQKSQSIHRPLSLEAFCSLCFDQSMSVVGEESKYRDNVSSLKGLQTECHEAKKKKKNKYPFHIHHGVDISNKLHLCKKAICFMNSK